MDTNMILIDAGHGISTLGKRSPDSSLLEYKYCREIADRVVDKLQALGVKVQRIPVDDTDISLSERCRLINKINPELLVSIHCNAMGNGSQWMSAKGWGAYVYNKASQKSRKLAECLHDEALKQGLKIRKPSSTQKYWEQNLGICRMTNCPAVLTENLFMDNKEDVKLLLSEEGKNKIIDLHVKGILDYLNKIQT